MQERSARTTIAAIASPAGGGPRGVLRLSGPAAAGLVRSRVRVDGRPPGLEERCVVAGTFEDGRGEQPVLLLWMPGPRSFTREDVAELHLCGSPPLLRAALDALLADGAVGAEPGEFTRRAFENGRLDLTRVEGVLEVVRARNEEQRRAGAALLEGGLAQRVESLRERLEDLRALCEASLDFDEADTGHVPVDEFLALGRDVTGGLRSALLWEERREPPAAGPRLALVGAPNAGKSSLFNRLARGGQALVADLEGTTRDGVSGTWEVAGVTCRLVDAPGLERPSREPDRQAQELARAERAGADLLLWVVDASRVDPRRLDREAHELPAETPRVLVWNQVDRARAAEPPAPGELERLGARGAVAVSARTGQGLPLLEEAVAAELGLDPGDPRSAAPGGIGRELSARHRRALNEAIDGVSSALAGVEAGVPLELTAEALRAATDSIDAIGGHTTPDAVLDRIFSRFCVGK